MLLRSQRSGRPAARPGLQAGDVFTNLDDQVATEADGLIVAVRSHEPDSVVKINHPQGGAVHTISATLASAHSD